MGKHNYKSGFVDKILGDIFYPNSTKIKEEMIKLLDVNKNTYILDVACRNGNTALFFAKEFGGKVVGIDFFDANIKEAEKTTRREKLVKNVTFDKGHAKKLPYENEIFDIVILERSLSCYEDKLKVLKECTRVLKKNGSFIMADFTVNHLTEDERNELNKLTCLTTALSLDEYLNLFQKAGLKDTIGITKKNIAEKNTKLLLQKWKKIRLFSKIFLKASSVDSDSFESLMKKGEKIIKEQRIGYALMKGTKI
ncbi:MAG: class I SAM-dependent methyltransferase [Candidatus Methanofastidiosia archaeon]